MTKGQSLTALKELRPDTAGGWSRLMLGLVFAGLMLLAGRVWGESIWQEVADRAMQTEAALAGLEARFEDHVTVEARQHTEILEQLREIRGMLQGSQ